MATENRHRKPRHRRRSRHLRRPAVIYVRPDPKGGFYPERVAGDLLAPQPGLPPGPTWQCGVCGERIRTGQLHMGTPGLDCDRLPLVRL